MFVCKSSNKQFILRVNIIIFGATAINTGEFGKAFKADSFCYSHFILPFSRDGLLCVFPENNLPRQFRFNKQPQYGGFVYRLQAVPVQAAAAFAV